MGNSPLHLAPSTDAGPVLTAEDVTDVPAMAVADPFMVRVDGLWHMFFEVINLEARRGEIGLATSRNGFVWQYRQIVLRENFHLSYPYVFAHEGDFFMIPETHKAKAVRLYRAVEFPTKWVYLSSLLEGEGYVDPSLCRVNGRWWLFVGGGTPPLQADGLRLYSAGDLSGPWWEHPGSPVYRENLRVARPAGRILRFDGRLIRFAQDCHPAYGTQVRALEIRCLSESSFMEAEAAESPILGPTGRGWNAHGMHHVDAHLLEAEGKWLACVDGWRAG